jgi:hypothetical protein
MKRTRRRNAVAVDHGTPERSGHDELVPHQTERAGVVGRRVKHACRLDWYWDKASLDDRQHEAGIRFRRDWLLAAASPKLTGTYGPRIGAGRHDFHALHLSARQGVATALLAVGSDLGAILVAVCGFDEWASGRLPRLREGLTLLADHYGMPRSGPL